MPATRPWQISNFEFRISNFRTARPFGISDFGFRISNFRTARPLHAGRVHHKEHWIFMTGLVVQPSRLQGMCSGQLKTPRCRSLP